jgi:hypothetical protein
MDDRGAQCLLEFLFDLGWDLCHRHTEMLPAGSQTHCKRQSSLIWVRW